MANETKKRLLLSKWREQDLRDDYAGLQELNREWQAEVETLTAVLQDVKYWMHEPLVLLMPMRDPRVILRRIEDVLG